jgi:hypothetical protein
MFLFFLDPEISEKNAIEKMHKHFEKIIYLE